MIRRKRRRRRRRRKGRMRGGGGGGEEEGAPSRTQRVLDGSWSDSSSFPCSSLPPPPRPPPRPPPSFPPVHRGAPIKGATWPNPPCRDTRHAGMMVHAASVC
eukprot:5398193-Pyramimonas_sp.AAC.1